VIASANDLALAVTGLFFVLLGLDWLLFGRRKSRK
jgi:LPXTG-motif cell wall-anchored protein